MHELDESPAVPASGVMRKSVLYQWPTRVIDMKLGGFS